MAENNAAIATISKREIVQWDGAVARAAEAKRERDEFIRTILVDGVDYGVIPGSQKKCLYKAGAEKVGDAFNLWPDYIIEKQVEDWDKPLFYYQVRCYLKVRGSDAVVCSGMGSCNSMEAKYRWRDSKRVCPECGAEAIIKGKDAYGGGWLCWKKQGGCGAKFIDEAQEIIGQKTGRVPNPDIYDQVNTILKMAKKRARVAAALDLGLSDQFTQDMEEHVENGTMVVEAKTIEPDPKPPEPVSETAPDPSPSDDTTDYPGEDWEVKNWYGDSIPVYPIGKHRGKAVTQLPEQYIEWGLQNIDNDSAKAMLTKELERRRARDGSM